MSDIAAGTGKPKADHYALIQELAEEFRKKNGSIISRDLLSGITSDTAPVPEARTDDYYKKRPCKDLAVCAAEILERKLEERKAQDPEKNGPKIREDKESRRHDVPPRMWGEAHGRRFFIWPQPGMAEWNQLHNACRQDVDNPNAGAEENPRSIQITRKMIHAI